MRKNHNHITYLFLTLILNESNGVRKISISLKRSDRILTSGALHSMFDAQIAGQNVGAFCLREPTILNRVTESLWIVDVIQVELTVQHTSKLPLNPFDFINRNLINRRSDHRVVLHLTTNISFVQSDETFGITEPFTVTEYDKHLICLPYDSINVLTEAQFIIDYDP